MINLHHIDARHDAVNIRLESWARWVQVRPQPWKSQPMFRLYKPPPQWEPRELKVEANPIECMEIERIVAQLPDRHRHALRWFYVYPYISDSRIRREVAETRQGLYQLLADSRDMVKNRLSEHLRNE